MNQPLPTYPDYKPAGLPWLAQVPAHWEIKRAKQVFQVVDKRSATGAEEKLTVSSRSGVVPRREQKVTMFMAASYVGHKLCWPGDLVINSLWAWANGLGFAKHHGIISTAYSVYRPLPEYAAAAPYLDYLVRSSAFQWELQIGSKGIWISRLQLTDDTFLRMPIVLPPLAEQQQIVAFLDAKGRQVARLLRAKRQLIKLLQEQKQALIHRAVTQGLNPDAPRKESGIFWLNSIPKHWQTVRIKDVVKCLNRTRVPLSSSERGQMKSQIFDYYGASGVIDKVEDYLFDDELLLIAEDGANLVLRNLPLAIIAKGKFWVNNHAHIFKPKHGNLEYLALLLESIDYRPWITGAAQPKLTQDRIMAVQLPYPPLIEQQRILTYIKSETHLFDETISCAQREIELIQEYRTRLVADVVTGWVDVRGLAVAVGGAGDAGMELVDEEETDEESETLLLEEADAD